MMLCWRMRSSHCSVAAGAALMALVPAMVAAQVILPRPAQEATGGVPYTIFLRGQPVGSEQISVTRDADGWTIVSAGRIGAPIDAVARRIEVRYTPDWKPLEFGFDATVRGQAQLIHTVVEGTTARTRVSIAGQPTEKSDTIAADSLLVLPNTFFGPFEALAARVKTASAGTTVNLYGVPQLKFEVRVGESANEQIQTAERLVATRRTRITMILPGAQLDGDLWTDDNGR